MRRTLLASTAALAIATSSNAAEWRIQKIDAPAPVSAIETINRETRVVAGGLEYRIDIAGPMVKFVFIDAPPKPGPPKDAPPDGRVATGKRDIVRAWLADPTNRYDHGILGDAIEASSLVIERRDGTRYVVRLKDDAVFEDLEPRLADLDGDGHDEIVVVKTYLKRGSSLAVVAERGGKYDIIAETPPLGAPHRWLNPAGIADFNGDGKTDIAFVRQPHVVGSLEMWSWADKQLRKIAEVPNVANHIAGTRQIDMAATADFDGDGIADLAVPSLDRWRLRIIAFAANAREIASVPLPSKATTNLGLVADGSGPPAIAVGLADGSLVLIRRNQ
jgi:hypothetical protein